MAMNPLETLNELMADDPSAYLDGDPGRPMFDAPLVAVADADDSWFDRFQEIIGPFYWTPRHALEIAVPQAKARSVLCWCLPVSAAVRKANRRETTVPARDWAYVRTFGEEFNTRLRRGMMERLRSFGYAAAAPAIFPENNFARYPGVGISSHWSERHTAFVAGLGTFGISGGLITRRGIAHRLGSVVTDAVIPPTARPYGEDPFAWCLRTSRGTCGACINRCPAGSIGEFPEARDKDACARYYKEHIPLHCTGEFGWSGDYGCGLCQTGVPCEDRNPVVDGSQ